MSACVDSLPNEILCMIMQRIRDKNIFLTCARWSSIATCVHSQARATCVLAHITIAQQIFVHRMLSARLHMISVRQVAEQLRKIPDTYAGALRNNTIIVTAGINTPKSRVCDIDIFRYSLNISTLDLNSSILYENICRLGPEAVYADWLEAHAGIRNPRIHEVVRHVIRYVYDRLTADAAV
jgi:hypothetical protein